MKCHDLSRWVVPFVSGWICCMLPAAAGAAPPACTAQNTVFANVVAIDQTIFNNRMGANLPGGMIFALARDVCARGGVVNKQAVCDPNATITPANVTLKPYKRPRPLVLRVNQGQCLKIGLTNLLTGTATNAQPSTRAASIHVQGLEWVNTQTCGATGTGPTCNDGSWVGTNPSGLVSPASSLDVASPQITYTLYAGQEGAFLLYSAADAFSNNSNLNAVGDGGQLSMGLFGAVHVEPADAEWYRSQVTAEDLKAASHSQPSKYGQPLIDYSAMYANKTTDPCFQQGTCRVGPVLRMTAPASNPAYASEIVHSDLTAVITGPRAGRFPAERPEGPTLRSSFSLPDRLQPFREFTIIYHEMFNVQQAFQDVYNVSTSMSATNLEGADNFGINYGMGGIGSEVIANRIGGGPMANCTTCKFEEFFLTSWAVGDPAMVVDLPTDQACQPDKTTPKPAPPRSREDVLAATARANAAQANGAAPTIPNYTCKGAATRAFYPDDPSNVYHSYISDHTTFRILHGGSDLHHVHHQHAHQWLHSPDTSNGDYLDSQSIGPGSAFSLEMTFNGSGNVNQTVGDSIFHCHFYPHFAGGMWSLWRVHDVYETGTVLDPATWKPVTGRPNRALPDGEIATGTPIPALVPLPTIPMPPMPALVQLVNGGPAFNDAQVVEVYDKNGKNPVQAIKSVAGLPPPSYGNPGFPFFVPGLAGQRAPHPPLDFAKDDDGKTLLDGGLPRHVVLACAQGPNQCSTIPPLSDFTDFSKTLNKIQAVELPEEGTFGEKLAMNFHSQRLIDSVTPENCAITVDGYNPPKTTLPPGCPPPLSTTRKAQFIVNGLPPVSGAPYADPCIQYSLMGGHPRWSDQPEYSIRRYKAADIQLDVTFNKEGWHFPQQRMIALWGDVADYLKGAKPPEPFFFRADSGDCIEYTLANLVPNVYELDDFQVRTPTDIIGQHIHLVKFDVTSSDGATNGFNYEDGTFAPNEVTERILAINQGGGLLPGKKTLTAKPLPFFGPGPSGQWVGAQATVQRWYTDRLFDNTYQHPGVDRTLRTVFTHDHFGPSTHQQAGLYAGLVIEPNDSVWYHNEAAAGDKPFGGDGGASQPLPSRTVTGYLGHTTHDGGPTTWQAVIVNPKKPGESFREFLLEFQDTTLTYAPFTGITVPPSLSQGYCSNNPQKPCTPATAANMYQPGAGGCGTGGVCYAYGFCSTGKTVACTPATATTAEDVSKCPPSSVQGTLASCNVIPGIPSSSSGNTLPVDTWSTTPLDNGGGTVELISFLNGTNSFSTNYRSEPLYPRIDGSSTSPNSGAPGDLSYVYRSIPRPGFPCSPTSKGCNPYPPLTKDVGPNDPFTPLLRAYAGDDVQIRTLVGAHINPHNFTVHGVKWLEEPSFVDSGWRNSQEMGISEHFEEIFRLPSVTGAGSSDYLYMSGAAAIEQAGGNWGLMRAYATARLDLKSLPQNVSPQTAPVCSPHSQQRSYTVVALTAKQALPGGQLVYNPRGSIADPNAILYFQLADLDCQTPGPNCKLRKDVPIAPLVLRANANDCLTVTLYNALPQTLAPGAQSPYNQCGSPGSLAACDSNTSTAVGLHPQLVSFDVTKGDAFNAGNNPVQTVAPGGKATYTWYAGNVDPTAPAGHQHIPIEFGAANLLPSDTINHHQYGLFGALIIEPPNASCIPIVNGVPSGKPQQINQCTGTMVQIVSPGQSFKELVLITQDGLSGPANRLETPFTLGPAWLSGDQLNAVNYRSELLFLPKNNGGPFRACGTVEKPDLSDFSCLLSNTALCCTSATTPGTCSTWAPCGEAQTPMLEACAGEQVRFRVLQAGGVNTNQVFEIYGHSWQEQPYMSSGKGCPPPTTHTNLSSSSQIGTGNGCGPLEQDTYSEYQGSRMGHGPSNHFDILIESAGGANKVPGDYLYRTYPADHFRLGLWGIFRVKSCGQAASTGGGAVAGAGGQ